MAEQHGESIYTMTFWYLLALTILEIAVALPWLGLPTLTKGFLLVGMALTKACLVALYFMHLRFERGTLMIIAFTPMLICTFLVFMLLPDLGGVVHKSSVKAEQTGVKH